MLLPRIGRARERILADLRDKWLGNGTPVALLEGFSGCGKSVLAGELSDGSKIPTVRVDACVDENSLQNLFIDLAIGLEAVGIDGLSKETEKGQDADLAAVFREITRRNRVLIVIDDAQHIFAADSARPMAKLAGVIKQLGNSSATGKLLLISNRIAEQAVWSENCFRVRLPPLEEDEAVELLSQLLEHQQRSDKVEIHRRAELVRCFGYNPRAIHTLVTCLEFETLNYLISSIPGMWDLSDIEVSPDLVVRLERDLLERILPRLEDEKNTAKFLRWLSVHRQPFRKEALEEFQGAGFSSAELLHSLVERMLIEYRHGWHTLNAIAREVSVQRLMQTESEWVQAHSLAANYHARHFRARQVVHAERLAGSFAELRYHLYHAKRLQELEVLSERFTSFIRRSILIHNIPIDRPKLDERIALLTVLLASQGAKALEYHLARCLLARGAAGDRKAALDHIRRATGPKAPFDTWLIRIDLEWEIAGFVAARFVWMDAVKWVPPSENAFAIYQRAGELLARDGDLKGAIAWLRDGIKKIPPEFSESSLYRLCGELMARDGDLTGAIALLRDGIKKIPPEFNQFALCTLCGELMAHDGNLKGAIALLREGIAKIPPEHNQASIYLICGELMARNGDLKGATALLREGIAKIPPEHNQIGIYLLCGELMAGNGDLKGAIAWLRDGIKKIRLKERALAYVLCGELMADDGDINGAIALLRDGMKEIPVEHNQLLLCGRCGELMARGGDLSGAIVLLRSAISHTSGFVPMETALRIAANASRKDLISEFVELARIKGEAWEQQFYIGKCLEFYVDEDWTGLLSATDTWLRDHRPDSLFVMRMEAQIGLGKFEEAWLDFEVYEKLDNHRTSFTRWLGAWLALRTNRQDEAHQLASQYAGLTVEVQSPVTEAMLVQMWFARSWRVHGSCKTLTRFFRSLRRWLESAASEETETRPLPDVPVGDPDLVSSCFLVVTTEWDSKNGGLSTFNRMLCKALVKANQTVVCYVPTASVDEVRRAAVGGIVLISAHTEAGVPPMATLLNPPEEIKALSPNFIIGHDRQSGGYAKVLQKRDFPLSKRVHFIHTAPEEIEPSKLSRAGSASKRGEERVREQKAQAKDTVLIVGVGPRLAREFANHIFGAGYAPVHEFNPGFDLDAAPPDAGGPITLPPGIVCLVLGRAEDYELKGLDLAARSMAAVADSWQPMALPKLIIRGAVGGTGDWLSKRLRGDASSKRPLPITVREYSEDLEAIQDDLRGASVLLMPSSVEGFGLVAAEAICMGVPILVSEQSGIAELLPHDVRENILPTRPDALTPLDAQLTSAWAEAIVRILNNRDKAFSTARKLQIEMAAKYTWEEAIRAFLKALNVFAQ